MIKSHPSDSAILACNGDPDEPIVSAPDADLIGFGRAVLALVDDPHKTQREAHEALQDRMFFQSDDPRVRALQSAIEGELDGLGISNAKAKAILRHVDGAGTPLGFLLIAPSRTSRQFTDDAGLAGEMLEHGWAVQPLVPGGWGEPPRHPAVGSLAEADSGGEPWGADFPVVKDDEIVTPTMDGYRMKCCDCGLVHTMTFRAIKVTENLPDGTFAYEELDPSEYRVSLSASRLGGNDGEITGEKPRKKPLKSRA